MQHPTTTLLSLASCIALLATPAPSSAQEACEVAAPMSAQRLLRRLSLDLRGGVPSYAETLAQSGQDQIAETTIDGFLRSPEFSGVMRSYHQQLLWPNIDQVEVVPETHVLYPFTLAENVEVWLSPLRSVFVRTISGALYGACKPEPAELDANGRIIAEPVMMGDQVVAYQEGYVEVHPWWAPETTIKVCGFDAQANLQAPACPGPAERFPFLAPSCEQVQAFAQSAQAPFAGSEVDCGSPLSIFAPGCGCGPDLRFCQTADTLSVLRQSLLDQQLRLIDRVITTDAPYQRILTEKTVDVNGPVVHYLENQSRLSFDTYGDPDQTAPVPASLNPADAETWVAMPRSGRHSGVLTTPGYLLRFASNRARAHRFYNAFECSSFIPAGALPSPFEPCSKHEDLTQRCGCDACHRTLEPMAASWGRFAEYGWAPIDDRRFPASIGASCTPPLSSVEQLLRCVRFYELEPVGEEIPYSGMLNSYVFRTPEQVERIEAGPSALAEESIQSGRFRRCTVQKLWAYLMRRAPTAEEEATIIPELQQQFADSGDQLRVLVKAIVTLPAYRRLP